MIGVDGVVVLVVVVMKDRLPLIEELVIRLFGICHVSCQVVSGIGGHRIKCPGWRTCDADGRRCVVQRDNKLGLGRKSARVSDGQGHNVLCWNARWGIEDVCWVSLSIQ